MSIVQLLGLRAVKPSVMEKSERANEASPPDSNLIYGVELEIEGFVDHAPSECCVQFISYTEDGSLRNNGYEFITKPMPLNTLMTTLNSFFHKNKWIDNSNYSERCSVHVHCNVGDLLPGQLASLTLLYTVFERQLFKFVGNDRDNNIFCVPIHQTQLLNHMITGDINKINEILDKARGWEKYTAFNMLPIFDKGSVEFRHMYGTNDLVKLLNWFRIIGHLFRYIRTTPYEAVRQSIIKINTDSRYANLTEQVFQDCAKFMLYDGFQQDMEDGVVAAKLALSTNEKVKMGFWGNYFVNAQTVAVAPQQARNGAPQNRVFFTEDTLTGQRLQELILEQLNNPEQPF